MKTTRRPTGKAVAALAALAILATTVFSASPASAAPPSATFATGENYPVSGITDGVYGYYGTDQYPARIVKVRLSDMVEVNSITLRTNELYTEESVYGVTSDGTYGYFATSGNTALIIKIRLSDMVRVDNVSILDFPSIRSGFNDGTYAYFAANSSPGRIVKIRMSDLAEMGRLTPAINMGLWASVTDGTYGYFGSFDLRGRVVKVRLSDFTEVETLGLNAGEGLLASAVMDPDGVHAYFGSLRGGIIKVRVSDMYRIGALEGLNDTEFYTAASDANFAYFYPNTSPATYVKVRFSDFAVVDSGELVGAVFPHGGAFADAGHMYVPSNNRPGKVTKFSTQGTPTSSCKFVDETAIPTWAREGACWLRTTKVTTSNPFNPSGVVTRAQMAGFLWRNAGQPPAPTSCGFTDAAAIPTWAKAATCWLKNSGLTTNAAFNPSGQVTRTQMAGFLWRAAGSPKAAESCGFTADAQIPEWARMGTCWLKEKGVTTNAAYNPSGLVTRAQMAAFLYRLI